MTQNNATFRKYEIVEEDIYFGLRHIDLVPGLDARVTLFVRTSRHYAFNGRNQRNCVADLYALFNESEHKLSGIRGPEDYICIEIIGHSQWGPKRISHVERNHPFHQAWEGQLREIFENWLKQKPCKARSMDVVRLGFNLDDPSPNPIVVSITVDWSVDPQVYENLIPHMRNELTQARFPDVLVEFERGEILTANGYDKSHESGPRLEPLTSAQISNPELRPGSSVSKGSRENPA